jgi:O-antigen/teichoic acid export membrane protein
MSLKKQALSGVIWTFLQQFGIQSITFVVSLVLTRLLLPSEFGLIGMITIFVALGRTLIDSGLSQSLIRSENPNQSDYSTVFYFNLFGSLVLYIIILLVAPYIADFYNQEVLKNIIRLYCLTFLINAFGTIQTTILTKQLKFKAQMMITIPSLILGSFTGITMAYMGYGVWSLVWSAIVQSFSNTLLLWFWSSWRPALVFDWARFNYHFHFGYKLTFSSVLDTVFNNIYSIIIGKFFAPTQVGFFTRADSLKQFPVNIIGKILNKVTFPLFASIQNDDVRLKNVYKKIMQMVVFLVAPLLVFAAVLAEPLFRFLFTEKWLPAVPYFQILCLNGILHPIHSYNLNVLKVKGRSDLFLKLEVLKKIILLVVILVSFHFGIFGLLYGSVLFSVLAFFINTHYTAKFINYTAFEQFKDIAPIILLSFFVGGLMHFIDIFVAASAANDFFRLLGSLPGVLIYLALAYVFKMKPLHELLLIIKRK